MISLRSPKKFVVDKFENFIFDGTATRLNVPIFFYDLQQTTKRLSNPVYFKILEDLNIKEVFVINSNAKIAIRKRTQRVTKQRRKHIRQKESSTKKPVSYLRRSPQTLEVVSKPRRMTKLSKRRKTVSFSTNEKKMLELNYTKGSSVYGSLENCL